MTSKTYYLGQTPSILVTYRANGTVTESQESDYKQIYKVYRDVTVTDTVRRAIPQDLFGSGTGYRASKYELICHGVGYQKLSSTQTVVALATRWWAGPSIATVSPPPASFLAGRLRANIKDTNVNLAQALGEYRQTADLFHSTALTLVRLFRSIRSGNGFADAARYLRVPQNRSSKNVANKWLAYQYGVKPLVSDLYGSCEALNKKLRVGSYRYITVRGREQKLITDKWPTDGTVQGRASGLVQFDCKAVARYKIQWPAVKQLAEVGITNPLSFLWEITPYSFVVDWMFPVGNWLASLDALVGTSDFSYYYITKTKGTLTGSTNGAGFTQTIEAYDRSPRLTNLPLPSFGYSPSDSLTKVLNGMALLRQLRK